MAEDSDNPKRTVFVRRDDFVPPAGPLLPDFGTGSTQPGTVPPQRSIAQVPMASAVPPGVTQRFGQAGALVGATLNDNYEVTRYITQGGMGEIYEGRQIRGNVKVAIKVILPQFAADPEFYKLLEREADLLATLGHDAIVKFRGLSQDPRSQVDYLTLEYVQGPSLEDQMDQGPIDAQSCRGLLRRLASGLDAAHDKGIYHRDLSPDNILLRDSLIERATIIDFGIAKDADTTKKTVIGAGFGGKLGFAAPEAFGLFGRVIGPWTDIYSLALVVAAAARGKVIDMGTASPIDAIQARQVIPPLDGVEPWLASVLARMLEPDPANRLRSMSDVIAHVDALPPVGTPFNAELATAPRPDAAPRFVRTGGMTTPPTGARTLTPFGRLDGPGETTDLRLVRAGETTTMTLPSAKSKLPLIIGGGVVLAAIVGGLLAFSGGDKAAETAGADAAAPATSAEATSSLAAPDWPTARTALAAIPCSDIRALPPVAGASALAVTGWVAQGITVPANAGGYRLETSALRPISPAPTADTCAVITRLKAAAGDGGEKGSLKLAPESQWYFSQLPKADGNFMVPNGLGSVGKTLFLVNITDSEADPTKRVGSFRIPAGTTAFPYVSAKPARNLQFFISAPNLPEDFAETGTGTAIARACAAGCTSTSGWLTLE